MRYTRLAGQETDVAERAVAECWRTLELFWRPWLLKRGDIQGLEHFSAARATGRGVVAAFPHFGMPYAQFPIMQRFGIDCWVVASPHHYQAPGDGYRGRFIRHARGYVDLLGPERGIPRPGIFERVAGLLRGGETVSIAFDMKGSMPTPFLGRMINLSSGPSTLACQTDAMVVPFVIRRPRRRPVLIFAPPLDPRDFEDAGSLQAALAGVFERWALEMPEAVWALEDEPGGPPFVKGPALGSSSAG